MHYVRTLKFEEAPDYDYLRGLFTKILQKINAQDDGVYDWVVLEKVFRNLIVLSKICMCR